MGEGDGCGSHRDLLGKGRSGEELYPTNLRRSAGPHKLGVERPVHTIKSLSACRKELGCTELEFKGFIVGVGCRLPTSKDKDRAVGFGERSDAYSGGGESRLSTTRITDRATIRTYAKRGEGELSV